MHAHVLCNQACVQNDANKETESFTNLFVTMFDLWKISMIYFFIRFAPGFCHLRILSFDRFTFYPMLHASVFSRFCRFTPSLCALDILPFYRFTERLCNGISATQNHTANQHSFVCSLIVWSCMGWKISMNFRVERIASSDLNELFKLIDFTGAGNLTW